MVSGHVFMFCASGLVFCGTEDVGSCFHFLHSWTHFRRYRGRPIMFSCFPHRDMFFCGAKGVGSYFHVLRARTHFRRYQGRRVPFSCFARPESFSAVSRVSDPVFLFFAPRHVFGCAEGVGSRFHVLPVRYRFRQFRGRRVSFSCFHVFKF
jgi:hypothetical protein